MMGKLLCIILLLVSTNTFSKGYTYPSEPTINYTQSYKPCMVRVNDSLYFDAYKITHIENTTSDNFVRVEFGYNHYIRISTLDATASKIYIKQLITIINNGCK
jgi:hypothetical protein